MGTAFLSTLRHFLEPLAVKRDTFGNLWLRIGTDPAILWSSHTDTCHRSSGLQDITCTDGIVRVAESGIDSATDIKRLRDAGYHAFLIGESLMRAQHPGQKLKELSQ